MWALHSLARELRLKGLYVKVEKAGKGLTKQFSSPPYSCTLQMQKKKLQRIKNDAVPAAVALQLDDICRDSTAEMDSF